jgi:hypothetical protein
MKSEKHREKLLEELRKTPIVEIACRNANIGRTTFYEWYKRNRKFRAQADIALFGSRNVITDLAESKLINGVKEGRFQEIRFWLEHNSPTYTPPGKTKKPALDGIVEPRARRMKVTVHHAYHSPTITDNPRDDITKPKQ